MKIIGGCRSLLNWKMHYFSNVCLEVHNSLFQSKRIVIFFTIVNSENCCAGLQIAMINLYWYHFLCLFFNGFYTVNFWKDSVCSYFMNILLQYSFHPSCWKSNKFKFYFWKSLQEIDHILKGLTTLHQFLGQR